MTRFIYFLFLSLLPLLLLLPVSTDACSSSNFDDSASQTLLSSLVLRGRVEHYEDSALASTRRIGAASGHYAVAFSVEELYKGRLERAPVRGGGQFEWIRVGPFGPIGDRDSCIGGPVTIGDEYVLFLQNITSARLNDGTRISYYKLSSLPRQPTPDERQIIEEYSRCFDCGEAPSVSLSSSVIEVFAGERIEVDCLTTSGKPKPRIKWFKNGRPLITNNTHVQLINTRERSRLTMDRATSEDSDIYECQAVNVIASSDLAAVQINVRDHDAPDLAAVRAPAQPPPASTTQDQHIVACSNDDGAYCFHGGSCYVMQTLGLTFCRCSPEYQGDRCQEKRVFLGFSTQEEKNTGKIIFVLIILGGVAGCFILIAIIITVIFLLCRKIKNNAGDRRRNYRPNTNVNSGNKDSTVEPESTLCLRTTKTNKKKSVATKDGGDTPLIPSSPSSSSPPPSSAGTNGGLGMSGMTPASLNDRTVHSNEPLVTSSSSSSAAAAAAAQKNPDLHLDESRALSGIGDTGWRGRKEVSFIGNKNQNERDKKFDTSVENYGRGRDGKTVMAAPCDRKQKGVAGSGNHSNNVNNNIYVGQKTRISSWPYDSDPDATVL